MAEINSINPRMLTITMMAKYLSATNWFCEELIRNKKLPATKYGKSWVVDIHDVNVWIEEQKKSEKLAQQMGSAVRIMTDEQAQQFFAGARRNEDGIIIGVDPDRERDPFDGEI